MPYFGNNPSPLLLNTVAQNGKEMTLDADADTSITADTDDQIDIKIGGADDFQFTANTFTAQSGSTIAAQALTATTITATGDVSLDGGSFVFNESSADKDFRVESNGNTHMLFVDGGNDKVMIGLETPEVFNGTTPPLQIEGTDNNKASLSITRNSNDNGQPLLILSKSRGTSVNSDTIVQDDDVIGEIVFLGADGNDRNSQAASITALVNGTPGSNDMPGALTFRTTADGAASATERMRILSNGYVGIGTTSPADHLTVEGFVRLNAQAGDANYIRFDNTDNTNGNIWRIGPGVYSHSTFSIYNQTDNAQVVNIEAVNDQLMFRSMTAVNLADDATAIAVANSFQGLVVVTSTSNALTAIYRVEGQNTPTLISGNSAFTNSDTDGKFCLISAASSNNVTFRNRYGATYAFKIASFGVLS